MKDVPLAIVGSAIVAVGVLIGLLFRWMFAADCRQMRAILHGPSVTAQVVGIVEREGEEDPVYGGGGDGFAPVVSFRTVDGESVTASGKYVFAGNRRRVPAVGTTMRVQYDPGDPARIYIRGWDSRARGVGGFLAAGPIVVFLGAVMLVIAFLPS